MKLAVGETSSSDELLSSFIVERRGRQCAGRDIHEAERVFGLNRRVGDVPGGETDAAVPVSGFTAAAERERGRPADLLFASRNRNRRRARRRRTGKRLPADFARGSAIRLGKGHREKQKDQRTRVGRLGSTVISDIQIMVKS